MEDRQGSNIRAIYPNPYRTGEAISITGLENGSYRLQLFNINGRIIESQTISGQSQASFSSNPHQGLYIIVLSDNSGVL